MGGGERGGEEEVRESTRRWERVGGGGEMR